MIFHLLWHGVLKEIPVHPVRYDVTEDAGDNLTLSIPSGRMVAITEII